MPSPGQAVLARLWWGPLRRPFEALARRTLGERVVAGPLRGYRFPGGLAYRLGIYELHVQEALCRLLGPGDVFYDVGGHHGYLSLLAASRVRPGGRVHVFEPLPENLAAIRGVLEANHLGGVELHAAAVCEGRGTAELYPGGEGTSAVASLVPGAPSRPIEVATTSLDLFRAKNPPPDLCKVDVEGAEERVLAGAPDLLAARATKWLIEVHTAATEGAVRDRLRELGYRIKDVAPPRRRQKEHPRHLLARPA